MQGTARIAGAGLQSDFSPVLARTFLEPQRSVVMLVRREQTRAGLEERLADVRDHVTCEVVDVLDVERVEEKF